MPQKVQFILLIFISFLSCGSNGNEKVKEVKNFEGKVYYKANYPGARMDENKLGNNIVVFYKEGFIRKENRNNKDSLIWYSIYNPKTNTSYAFGITSGNDTVTFYHPIPEDTLIYDKPINSEKTSNEMLLGYSCKKVGIKTSDNHYIYYISDQLKVDKKFINGTGANFLYDNYVLLKYSFSEPVLKEVVATQINFEMIDESVFTPDTLNKILVELE